MSKVTAMGGIGLAWWQFWKNHNTIVQQQQLSEKLQLYQDICRARRDWEIAYEMFQEAVGEDQIDYAIYVLEATEKKYEMLLKQAKRIKLSVLTLDG